MHSCYVPVTGESPRAATVSSGQHVSRRQQCGEVGFAVGEQGRQKDLILLDHVRGEQRGDLLNAALEKLGGTTMRSLRVAVKPGQHVAFALLGGQRVPAFGLPGNPVAALVTYELYVRPALRAMAGCRVLDRPRISAIAETDLPRRPGPKLHLVRVTARTGPGGELRVRPSGGQDSHMLRAMAQANALALLPDGDGVRAGGRVAVLLLDTEGLGPDGAITPS